jgi:hypothetical protein
MAHWGVPNKFHVHEPYPFELAVVEFAPRRHPDALARRETFRLATNGMHNYPQFDGSNRFRTELYVCSRATDAWLVQLLTTLARYPLMQETCFGEFDTIPLAKPVHQNGIMYAALLLTPPDPEDSCTLGAICDETSEPIFVHKVVGITQPEYEFALRHHNGGPLWERLAALGQPMLIDEARPDAVLGMR